MARLNVYCLPDELLAWLHGMMEARDLSALLRGSRGGTQILSRIPSLAGGALQFFLAPSSVRKPGPFCDLHPREDDWITVRPGRVISEDTFKIVTQSEIIGEGASRADGHVRWLKRRLTTSLRKGVKGITPGQRGGRPYRDIYYTPSAAALLKEGYVWKQLPGHRAVFVPLGAPYGP